MNKKLDRKWLVVNAVIVFAFLLVIILTGMVSGMETFTNAAVFAENVTINGHDLGNKTYEEGLKTVLQEQKDKLNDMKVTVIYNGAEGIFGANELGVSTDAEQVLRQAYNYNKQGTVMEDFVKSFDEVHLETKLQVDEQKLQNSIMEFLQDHYVGPATDSGGDAQTFTYTENQQVFAADLQEVARQVVDRINNEDPSPVIV